ncbi:MAG: beta-mannosidase [Tannerella sp.]|jgi:mannan endo-1,4-beta-mannosidase|nr:beta-mannosidase [Tannerella sp.]
MKKSIFFSLMALVALFLAVACKKSEASPDGETDMPRLVLTIPANNAVVSPSTEKVAFVFDCNIVLIDRIKITINGESVRQVSVSNDTLTATLNRLDEKTPYTIVVGENAIKADPGKLNKDTFSLMFTTDILPPTDIKSTLAVGNPSSEAVRLYNFLKDGYGKKILSGTVANVSWNINEAEWIYRHTGKYPALNAFDFIFLFASPSDWIDYGDTKVVEDWWNAGGIVSCMWHWNVPKSAVSSDRSFYTSETDFNIREALRAGTPENAVIMADLQKIKDCLLLLKDKNIPVLWRPLHEAAGNTNRYSGGEAWFWWGAKGAEPCKELWRLMYNYFENAGLNNLIWVWTSETGDDDWYPGDEYVDIIGRDMYNKPDAKGMLDEYNYLKSHYPDKIITLSECGSVAQIPDQWNEGATWSWFMTWYDYERTNNPSSSNFDGQEHQHAPVSYWKNAFADERVITRDEMPNLK